MKFREPIQFKDLIDIVKHRQDRNLSYCIYCSDEIDSPELNTVCYIDSYPEITDDDEEVYSTFVCENNLALLCREELLQDVVDNALSQKPYISQAEILSAFIYYNDNDDFLTFESE